MSELRFQPFEEEELLIYASWFADAEIRRWLQPPDPFWFQHVHEPGNQAWLIFENDIPVGFVQLDTDPQGNGYFLFATNPICRKQGYGKRILQSLRNMLPRRMVKKITGCVEAGNIASIKCLRSAGFTQSNPEPDPGGFFYFSTEVREGERE